MVYMLLFQKSLLHFYETWYTRAFDSAFFDSEVKNSKFKMANPYGRPNG